MSRMLQIVVLGGKNIGLMETASPNKNDLVLLKGLLEAGKIVPVIDRTYPLREVAKAIAYLEAGHARGKVVITMAHDNQG